MKLRKDIITVAIDAPAAAGAGTLAKLVAKEYNLIYLDTGKIYRFVGLLSLNHRAKFNYKNIKYEIKKLKVKKLNDKKLLTDKIAIAAAKIAKDKKIRKIIKKFQTDFAYNPPKNYSGSVKKKIKYPEVLKSIRNRDYLDKNRIHSPLKKTKDSILINTSKLSKKASFNKIKSIIDEKIKILDGNL